MAIDIAQAAEGKIWATIQKQQQTVGDIAALTGFTPQYTRKALRSLERADLAGTVAESAPTVWAAYGTPTTVLRFVKTREAVASSRTRRANCIKLWRHLHRQQKSLTVADLARALGYDGPTTQSAIRYLKLRKLIDQAEAPQNGRSLFLITCGTQEQMLVSLANPEIINPEPEQPRFPRVNSVWALGSAAAA